VQVGRGKVEFPKNKLKRKAPATAAPRRRCYVSGRSRNLLAAPSAWQYTDFEAVRDFSDVSSSE
jgi:hypothetical protein